MNFLFPLDYEQGLDAASLDVLEDKSDPFWTESPQSKGH